MPTENARFHTMRQEANKERARIANFTAELAKATLPFSNTWNHPDNYQSCRKQVKELRTLIENWTDPRLISWTNSRFMA